MDGGKESQPGEKEMTKDEILELARQADVWVAGQPLYQAQLEKFAKLVAKKEREECARLCENSISSIWEYSPDDVKEAGINVCNNLAKSIRARG
jgi:hypothetical protein